MLPPAQKMDLGAGAHRALSEFVRLMRNLSGVMEVSKPDELLEEIIKAIGFEAYITEQEKGDDRWEFVRELVTMAKDPALYDDLEELEFGLGGGGGGKGREGVGVEALSRFLEGVSLHMSAETLAEGEVADAVKLMTMHASKGLEFDTVFITGCEENLIPFKRVEGTGEAEDEEVRLFYVGLTRAKRRLFLCRTRKRRRFGQTSNPNPSPFLEVISRALNGGGGGGSSAGSARFGVEAGGLDGSSAQQIAAGLAAGGAKAETGGSFARGGGGRGGWGRGSGGYGGDGGYGGRGAGRGGGGRGGGRSGSGSSARVEQFDSEATGRREARRAAAASKKAAAAVAAAGALKDGPRTGPRRSGRKGVPPSD